VQHGKTLAQTIWPLPQWGHHKESFSVRRRAKACAVVSISDFTWRWVVGQRYTSTAESPDCCGRHNRLFEIPLPLAKEILRLAAELRPQPATSAGVRHSMVCIQEQQMGGVRPNARENGQISHSTTVRAARGAGSRPHLASVFQPSRKSANIHISSGVIWGMWAK
jgi:hypothetical protein